MNKRSSAVPRIKTGLVFLFAACSAQIALAQRVLLPPSYGATPISTIIHAEAAHIVAQGSFLLDASIARRNNAIAAKQEIENSVAWVSSYFEKKRINQRYRAETEKNYLQRQQMANQMTKSLVLDDFEIELKTDPTDKLNWMLRQLSALASDSAFVSGTQDSVVDSAWDKKLSGTEVHHISFTDGGRTNGQKLLFRADSAEVLDVRWPRVLLDPSLDEVRTRFEWTRDEALRERKDTKSLSYQQQEDLRASVDALCAAYKAAWPRERRLESMEKNLSFNAGQKFLQSLALGVYRATETTDDQVFDGSYRFQGNSVADLVAHMHKYGLEFSSPQPGDEGAYRQLFFALRTIYKHLADSNQLNG